MAIQVRRGKKKDFNPDKMLPGEWAGTTDTKEVYFAFAPGDTKKMATYEDMAENIREATGEITADLTKDINTAINQAETAAQNANQTAETIRETTTQLTREVNTAIENSNTAAQTAGTAAREAQEAAEAAREATAGIGTTAGVTGIKGNMETEYRTGNVNLTPANIGALSATGNAGNNTVTFTSNDSGPDGDPAIHNVGKLTSGMKLSAIMQHISQMFTNVRYLLRLVGTTDITSEASKIGDGTVTGAIAALHTSWQEIKTALITAGKNTSTILTINTGYFTTENNNDNYVEKTGNCARLQLNVSLATAINAWSAATVTTIPAGYRPTRLVVQYLKLNVGEAVIRIGTNGNVSLQAFQSAACNFIMVSIPYLI